MAERVKLSSLQDASEMVSDASVADVKMLIESPTNEGRVIVVVEGADDEEVYTKVMDVNAVRFYPDCNCDKHSIILGALNGKYFNRLLAIKDADFDRLEGIRPPFSNLFLTDTHDLEGMIVSDCLPELVGEDSARCRGIVLDNIYSDLEDISYLKWCNHACHAGINFRSITLVLDIDLYFNAVVANTNNVVTLTMPDVTAFKNAHLGAPKKEICNGHDLFERIYVFAKAAHVSNFAKKPFFRRLRKAYPETRFVNTSLFQAIKKWEESNGQSILSVA